MIPGNVFHFINNNFNPDDFTKLDYTVISWNEEKIVLEGSTVIADTPVTRYITLE